MEWFVETLHSGWGQRLRIDKLLFEAKTEYQDLKIFENSAFGRVMTLDGVVQTTERDEFVYHEMLTHLPIVAHGNAKKILIIGGGDGGMLEEALKHPVEQVTMVEIDGTVVELAKTHLGSICGDAFEDERTNLVIADGARFVAETGDKFDVIIIDSCDPIGPAEILFSGGFYGDCRRCLNEDGILVTQNGVPFLQSDEAKNTAAHFRHLFRNSGFYVAPVPTYVGGFMAFGWACQAGDISALTAETIEARFKATGIEGLKYYNPGIHRGAFGLPNFLRDLMKD